MTTKTKSTRRATRPTPSRTNRRRGEGWGQMCARVMSEADAEMAKVDALLAKMSAEKKTKHHKDWSERIARLMAKSAEQIQLVDELLTKMETQLQAL